MFTATEINSLKERLDEVCGSYTDLLMEETGFSRPTISKFFNHHKIKARNAEKIYDTSLTLLQKYTRKQKNRAQKLNNYV